MLPRTSLPSITLWFPVLCCSFAFLGAETSHQTAHYEVAIGAEMEVLTRHADLEVVRPEKVLDSESPTPGPGVSFSVENDALAIPLVQTLFSMAKVEGTASLASGDFVSASGFGAAGAFVQLVNLAEDPLEVRLEVSVPGRRPDQSGPNEFFYLARTDENLSEFAAILQQVEVVGSTVFESLPVTVFDAREATRDRIDAGGVTGMVQIDAFGLPFSRELTITVPPSIETTADNGEVEVEITRYPLGLITRAGGEAGSAYDGSRPSEPIVFEGPSFDPERPLPEPGEVENIPVLSLWSLVLLVAVLVTTGLILGRSP